MKVRIDGRYPQFLPACLDKNKMTIDFISTKQDVTIRLDDTNNLDFWLEITLTKDQLKQLLTGMDEVQE